MAEAERIELYGGVNYLETEDFQASSVTTREPRNF